MKLMPQLNSNAAGQLLLHSQRGSILVRPIACFPWSEPNIRDLSGDLYQIKDPTALDPVSQKLVWAFME
jgi:hypothetical protein